jgi:hypothetical protein
MNQALYAHMNNKRKMKKNKIKKNKKIKKNLAEMLEPHLAERKESPRISQTLTH